MTPFVLDRAEIRELPPLSFREVEGAGPQPPLWKRLWARAPTRPTSSPWGEIVGAQEVAPGIVRFETANRRGYRLSRRRQAALPHYLRTQDGWYEDTTEWAAVAVVFDRIFDRLPAGKEAAAESLYDAGVDALRNWRPEEYERWFQTTLDMDVIWSLPVMEFHRSHADRWIALDVVRDPQSFVPHSYLQLRAKQGGDPPYGAEIGARCSKSRWFLVGADEFTQKRGKPFLIDLARHREIERPASA